jgi:hypothetical protein
MTRRPRRAAAALIAILLLAGCSSGEIDTGFTGAAPVSYDGVWTGSASRSQGGERTCPAPTPFVVTIANNRVSGEVRNRHNRDQTVSRFDAIVDADGRLTARAWYDGIPNDIALEYNGTRFTGRITNPQECVFSLRLTRS